MTLLEILKKNRIDFTKSYIYPDRGSPLKHKFDITPKEFLSFSKQDFKADDKRGRVNALSNAKRAIDCQTDKIFACLGLNPAKFPESINLFIENVKSTSRKDIKPHLLFLQALRFAPASIIAKTRNLRHSLEHYYQEPTHEQVSEAIDLADLFITATDSKLNNVWDFVITDDEEIAHQGLNVSYDFNKRLFKVIELPIEIADIIEDGTKDIVRIGNDEVEYYHLMKISTSLDDEADTQEALIELLTYIGHPIPKQHIRVTTNS